MIQLGGRFINDLWREVLYNIFTGYGIPMNLVGLIN